MSLLSSTEVGSSRRIVSGASVRSSSDRALASSTIWRAANPRSPAFSVGVDIEPDAGEANSGRLDHPRGGRSPQTA